jgi:hypothetical protein
LCAKRGFVKRPDNSSTAREAKGGWGAWVSQK